MLTTSEKIESIKALNEVLKSMFDTTLGCVPPSALKNAIFDKLKELVNSI